MTGNDYTLYELNRMVRSVLESSLDEEYWVVGELSDATQGYGGHFYGELIEKEEDGKRILARARVTCWARTYNLLSLRFQRDTGQTLHAGMKVRLLVRVTFHEQYGYALNMLDADSNFTLGDMAKRRREILEQLERDGILHDNQTLKLPRLLKRIAVVSAAGAAGYGDFCNQLAGNDYGLAFTTRLFPAVMQGARVEETVSAALQAIADEAERWDIVVIIRGGGATGDLSDFDSYLLASCIAQFPLPVITGIGHERDETVLDYVAHTRVKTPTAAAAFIIDHQAQEAALLDDLYRRIALIRTEADADDLTDELIDRFGDPPGAVNALIHVALLRGEAGRAGISDISQKGNMLYFKVENFDMETLSALYAQKEFKNRVKLEAGREPRLGLRLRPGARPIPEARALVEAWNKLQKPAAEPAAEKE